MTAAAAATPTVAQIEAAVRVAHVVYECVRHAGADGIPSGHVYAATMAAFDSVGAYETCLGLLLRAGLVRRSGHVLYAAGAGS